MVLEKLLTGDRITAHCNCGKIVASMTVTDDSLANDLIDAKRLSEDYAIRVNYPGSVDMALNPCHNRQCALKDCWSTVHGKLKI